MPSCLGLYVEDKLIKYAKVSKEKDKISIENFGVEFYEDLPNAIAQIIEETASEKTPISINVNNEIYEYFKIFGLLNKKDLKDAIETEVESICFEKGISRTNIENRYIINPTKDETGRLRVLSAFVPKSKIMENSNLIGNGKLFNSSPLPLVLPEILKLKEKENSLIVNIEQKTTFISIIEGNLYEVEKSNYGMGEILEKINFKENSYSKAYEICKNTTIFTSDINELDNDSNLYLEDIMPTLYSIVEEMKSVIEKLPKMPTKLYITGSAALINNIDLYFKEYVEDIECLILKPAFIDQTKVKQNIKDYIEVNSAIAMATTALKEKPYDINFLGKAGKKIKSTTTSGSVLKTNITLPKFDTDLKSPLDKFDIALIRIAIAVLLIFSIYMVASILLANGIKQKNKELISVKNDVQAQIDLANADLTKIKAKLSTYKNLRENLEQTNQKTAENFRAKNSVPNFLYHIMNIIPDNVEITEIQNTTDSHVVITARSHNYQHLAYFTAALKQGGVFYNVISGTAEKIVVREVKENPSYSEKIISLKTESKIVKDAEKGYVTEKTTKAIIEKEVIQVTIEGDLQ